MPEPKDNTFRIGLCLAGAVSAGAYTAGVLDYLLEALEEWEKRRGQDGVPSHRVEIPVIGGASAGGITGLLLAAVQHSAIEPVRKLPPGDLQGDHPENPLYHTWVDLIDRDMFKQLLDQSDLNEGKVYSMVNAEFIPALASRVIRQATRDVERPYLPDDTKVFTSVSNLKGFKMNVAFKETRKVNGVSVHITPEEQERNQHIISVHGDYACFQLNAKHYANNGWTPVDFHSNTNLEIAGHAAMCTGAFPVGLKSRRLQRPLQHVKEHPFLNRITAHLKDTDPLYNTINVDGGLVDNEPFDKVRKVLNTYSEETEPENGDVPNYDKFETFRSTVLLVDPFPSPETTFDCDDTLLKVVGNTLSAMFGQLRVKPDVLKAAMSEQRAGQHMIAPSREVPPGWPAPVPAKLRGSDALACGGLGGFAGFLHKEFRVHDYFLGRMNCRKFLRQHFTMKDAAITVNPIFVAGYGGNPSDPKWQRLRSTDGELPIIPLFDESPEGYLPEFGPSRTWPVRRNADIDRYKDAIKSRAVRVLLMIFKIDGFLGGVIRAALSLFGLRKKIAEAAINVIKDQLRAQALLPGDPKEKRNKAPCIAPEPLNIDQPEGSA